MLFNIYDYGNDAFFQLEEIDDLELMVIFNQPNALWRSQVQQIEDFLTPICRIERHLVSLSVNEIRHDSVHQWSYFSYQV